MNLQIALIVILCFLGVLILLWVFVKKSIRHAVKKRELKQQIAALRKNKRANKRKAVRDVQRKKTMDHPLDSRDPWFGVRRKKTNRKS